mmetsp:Transcript_31091/g.65529  ORF Transcript_31091/g.65529 Transcript_31091/m.65529 type:complete len:557 (-) Transcript_31091:1956-3626(-)
MSARVYAAEAAAAERARSFLESQLLESDFSWMRESRASRAMNPRTTRSSCFYDFTRGVVGSHQGAPMWMEGRGKWLYVRQGAAKVPCYKGYGDSFVVLRVPFRKNGGGVHLNQYTVTMQCKMAQVVFRGLLCTAGWDQWAKPQEGDDDAQLFVNDEGVVGASDGYGNAGAPKMVTGAWHTVSCVVDAISGVLRSYIDGVFVSECKAAKVCKDGQHALKGRLAIFHARNRHSYLDYYLRSVTVHNRLLTPVQVQREHAMLEAMLMEDAIAAAPTPMQLPLTRAHELTPFRTTKQLLQKLRELVKEALSVAAQLWDALVASDTRALDRLLCGLDDSTAGVCMHWMPRDASGERVEIGAATAPFGETLLHCAAFYAHEPLARRLLENGADANALGLVSSCTPLHAAAAGGHARLAQMLIDNGAKVNATNVDKRTPLYVACARMHTAVAHALVRARADPYVSEAESDSPVEMLRRSGKPASLQLMSQLDEIFHEIHGNGGALSLKKGDLEQGRPKEEDGDGEEEEEEEEPDDEEDDEDDDDDELDESESESESESTGAAA